MATAAHGRFPVDGGPAISGSKVSADFLDRRRAIVSALDEARISHILIIDGAIIIIIASRSLSSASAAGSLVVVIGHCR